MPVVSSLVAATNTLTSNGTQPADDGTVVLAGKTYTFKAAYSNTDGHVTKGASAAATLANLKAAINLEAGAGSLYAAAMTQNPEAIAVSVTSTVLALRARTPGVVGNRIPFVGVTNLTVGGATFSTGAGSVDTFVQELIDQCQLKSDELSALLPFDSRPTVL